jgi:GT2 family glycosyltransferase
MASQFERRGHAAVAPRLDRPMTTMNAAQDPRPILADISVIIPTVGRAILQQSLEHIISGSAWPRSIIVVDQGQKEEISRWVEQLRELQIDARYLPSGDRGKSAALNRGIAEVETPFLAVIDDDCFADPEWLGTAHRHLASHPGAIITGPALPTGTEPSVAALTSAAATISRRPGLFIDPFCGSNMAVATASVRKVGPFDEAPCLHAAAEDLDWSYRALKQGIPIIYAPDVIVQHFGWRDASQRRERYQAYARSHGCFYGKHLRRWDWRIGLRVLIHHARALRTLIKGTLTRDKNQVDMARAYLAGLAPGILVGMTQRRVGED